MVKNHIFGKIYKEKVMAKKTTKTIYRSSITGKFVSKKKAEKNPKTTEKQRVRA